jgi:hypothetical protein
VEKHDLLLSFSQAVKRHSEFLRPGDDRLLHVPAKTRLSTPRITRSVEDYRPYPGLQVAVASKPTTPPHCVSERVLNRVAPRVFVSHDRGGNAREITQALPVQGREFFQHYPYDATGRRVSLSALHVCPN